MSHNGANRSNPSLNNLDQHGKKIQELIARVDSLADPEACRLLQECMETVLAFYGEGLARILDVVKAAAPGGEKVCDALARDAVVRGFLLIHGLHPLSLEARLREALDKVSAPELVYPHWHQLATAKDRFGPADLALLGQHLKSE